MTLAGIAKGAPASATATAAAAPAELFRLKNEDLIKQAGTIEANADSDYRAQIRGMATVELQLEDVRKQIGELKVPAALATEVLTGFAVFALSMLVSQVAQVLNGVLQGYQRLDIATELAYELAFDLPWQKGDAVLVDNFVTMHGRRTFRGTRKVLASLTMSDGGSALSSRLTSIIERSVCATSNRSFAARPAARLACNSCFAPATSPP